MVRQLRRDGVCNRPSPGSQRCHAIDRPSRRSIRRREPACRIAMHLDLSLSSQRDAPDRPAAIGSGAPTSPISPSRRGFLYLVAIMDWATRHVLSWRLYERPWTLDSAAEALGRSRWTRIRPAGDIQYGSGQPVHQPRLHRRAQEREHPHLGKMDGRGLAAWTTSSSSACGGLSSMRRSTYTSSPTASTPNGSSASRIGFYNTERPHGRRSTWSNALAAAPTGPVQPVDIRCYQGSSPCPHPHRAQQQQQDVIKRILAA